MSASLKPLIKQGWLRALLFLIPWTGVSIIADLAGTQLITNVLGFERVEMGDNFQTLLKYVVVVLLAVLAVWLWRKMIDRKDLSSLGFEWKPYADDAWTGLFAALALLGVGTLILAGLGYLQYAGINFDPLQLTIEIVLMMLIAFYEELVIRGYILNNLLQSFNKWLALGISAALFALMHLANPEANALSMVNILVAGLVLGVNYIYTRNLWFGIFFHFAWNFFQGPIYGYEVSGIKLTALFEQTLSGPTLWTGGPFGFEASLLCMLLLLAAVALFARFYSKRYNGLDSESRPLL